MASRLIYPRLAALDPALLARWYVEERRSAGWIAAEVGRSSQYVRDALRAASIPLRPAGANKEVPVDAATLRRWYVDEGLSCAQIAARIRFSASGVAGLLARHGIPARRFAGSRPVVPDPGLVDTLRELHHQQRLPLVEVARRMGLSVDQVKLRMVRGGLSILPPQRSRLGLTAEVLTEWHVEQGLTVPEIAARAGCNQATVRELLHRFGVPHRRAPRQPDPRLASLTRELLEELYCRQRLTRAQVAAQLGCSVSRIAAGLHRHGIQPRPRGTRPDRPEPLPLTRELLEQLYVSERRSVADIARHTRHATGLVRQALVDHGDPLHQPSPRSPSPLDPATLRQLYVEQRWARSKIASAHQVPEHAVTIALRRHAIHRPAVPPPHPPPPAAPPDATLHTLYLKHGRTLAQLAQRFHTSVPIVRGWLLAAKVPITPRTSRASRADLPAETLQDLYWAHGLSGREVAEYLGAALPKVLRAMHDHGIPVRTRRRHHATIQLLDELYDDRQITDALARSGVPQRPQPGTIAERFPVPVPLGERLLGELYDELGLSARHIELLTGQPHEQILDALRAAGLKPRRNAGASPWRRRLLGELPSSPPYPAEAVTAAAPGDPVHTAGNP
ncbi:MAG TPA: hypothetical protein VNG13_14020 [Mycobacteriales bacterium]|nr:hypothetical protein [Mycobacteriales bacterium]